MHSDRPVILVFPPVSSVWHLPVGIAYLASVLEERNIRAIQRYAHIAGVEHVLMRQNAAAASAALSAVRNPDSSIFELHRARVLLEEVSSAVPTDDTFVVERNNVRYDSRSFKGGVDQLLEVVRAREKHLFYDYFISQEVPAAVAAEPLLYGISIADERQLVSGWVLASLVKEALPGTLVVLGGNYWSRVQSAYAHDGLLNPLFQWCDAIVHSEGFTPIVELARGSAPSRVPGVVWYDGRTVRKNPPAAPTSFDGLPAPVFDRRTRQWSSEFVPPLYTMSNCPMQCSYCSISGGSDTFLAKPRTMSEARLADRIGQLGAARVDIQDELMTIPRQLRLGRALASVNSRVTWQCYLTATDRLLDGAVCEQLAAAGCGAVQLGLESLDPATLQQESKPWNHPASYGRILENLHNVGIQTHVFIIVGCPTEPISWAVRWLAFLEEYGDYILTIKAARYRLTRKSPDEALARSGRLPGVEIAAGDLLPLNLNRDQFRYTTGGLSRKRVEAVRDVLEEACRRHWAYEVTSTIPWWINRGRYSLGVLRDMAASLDSAGIRDAGLPRRQLERAYRKVGSALRDELGGSTSATSFEDLRDHAARLRAAVA